MSNNSLSGAMPRSRGIHSTLRFLILSNNKFSGELTSMKNCTDMRSLDLGKNKFSGDIPSWIGESMLSLWILRLSSHSFTGNIPSQLCGLSNLHILDLSNNDLLGHIPLCVGNLSGLKISVAPDSYTTFLYQEKFGIASEGRVLEYGTIFNPVNILDLSNNNLSGTIPSSVGLLTSLGFLLLSGNTFSGEVPSSLKNCTDMKSLDLGDNKFSGRIPTWIGESMLSLWILRLTMNSFTGNIPSQLWPFNSSHIGSLTQLSLWSYSRLPSLDLANNYLSGEMPVELTSLIGNLEWIETLDLSMNQLSSSIPPSMVSLTFLSCLNLSHNHLSGKAPTGSKFSTLVDPSIYEGNTALCRYPLPNGCRDNEETPHVPSEDGQDDSELEKLWIISSMVAGFIVGFWGVCGSLVMIKSWRHAYFNFLDKVKYALVDFVSDIVKHLQWGTVAV
ncbi:hypothetical protein ACLB2K_032443 [Fragaria x ananassa]